MSATFRVGDRVKVLPKYRSEPEHDDLIHVGMMGTVTEIRLDGAWPVTAHFEGVGTEMFIHDELELVEAAPVNVPDEEPRTVRDLIDAWEAFDGDDVDDFFREWEPVFRPIPNDVERMFDMPSPEADALDRIADVMREANGETDDLPDDPSAYLTRIDAILRETGRL